MKTHDHNTAVGSIRVLLGLTQQELAESLCISRSLLSMVEIGKRSLPPLSQATLMKMDKTADKIPMEERDDVQHRAARSLSTRKVYNRVNRSVRRNLSFKAALAREAAAGEDVFTAPGVAADINAVSYDGGLALPGLDSREACIALSNMQMIQKETLEHQLQHMLLEREAALVKGRELGILLTLTVSMIDIRDEAIARLPPGRQQKNGIIKKAKLFYKKLLLERQLEGYDSSSILLREHRINIAEGHLRILKEYMDAVQRRMEAL
jgi:transcriptional regulator with XRE-family HTH domain